MDLQAFLAKRDDCLLLSFRGSIASLNNWVGNFNAEQTDFGSSFAIGDIGKTHRGFTYGLTHSLWMQILTAIDSLDALTEPLWITGHSLGGAFAVLAAAAFYFSKRRPVAGLYTFGQPRVGDMKFAVTFDSQLMAQHYRFVNAADIVPHVPPPILPVFVPPHLWPPSSPIEFLTYNHTGRVLMFDDNGDLSNSEASWDIDVTKLSLMSFEERLQQLVGEVNLIVDHDIALYRKRIQGYIDGGMKPELHW
jgi:triacylglycerol lipase